jgi:hypothetical protein
LKHIQPSIVRSQSKAENGEKQVEVWCIADGSEDDEMGLQFTSEGEEEFVVWIEKHQLVESSTKEGVVSGDTDGRGVGTILCYAVARMSCLSFLKTELWTKAISFTARKLRSTCRTQTPRGVARQHEL